MALDSFRLLPKLARGTWAEIQPDDEYVLNLVIGIIATMLLLTAAYKQKGSEDFLEMCGVSLQKVARTTREVERKMFHICLLICPMVHMSLLKYGWSNLECIRLVWSVAIVGCATDMSRLYSKTVMGLLETIGARRIMRAHEMRQLTGGFYMGIGVATTMTISPPSICTAAILFLVLGDMSAAIIGVSFGGDACVVKLGRTGKKSLEGSLAMFFVCFGVGCLMFLHIELREYPVFWGALAATLVELYEPLGINDNLTIPVISSLVMQWGMARIAHCTPAQMSFASVWQAIVG